MKIVVIGGSHYSRASTVKKLQRKGLEAEAVPTRASIENLITDYRDAGYAGQHLRRRLRYLGWLIHELWRKRRSQRSKFGDRS
ncbi:hypothetical protein [Mesorhizobium sp. M1D.F.Ca.ET.043.01.1.1]|uniref:hypothetical protein n=1 Tax=Mesorhizobium sp. M1D.F.Ca.ET.043.01.1.1 TaxID=2493669 RepID=UPI000F74C69B|nr:hypothetical protein [Mesorhizobium sp. M1D.F.Ca.ET.043.01.1.1]AZO69962.1 hypothetical protein EJ067_01250 [Mesorhizobium sp. M1D.F.Ca.ET.043.01.1.1]